jgi:hypothetical protein
MGISTERVRPSLCDECEHCPVVMIEADSVDIGEAENTARLTHAAWNRLVQLIP